MNINRDISHRKAACKLLVTDSQGKPVKNTRLKLKQVQHEFLFGCGAFDFLPYTNPMELGPLGSNPNFNIDKDFLQDRVNKWLALYNYATLPFYWGGFEPVEGEPKTESRMNAAKYLKEHGVTLKGHPLCWHTSCANWLMDYDNKTILKKQLERIDREVTGFKGIIDKWDVINEVVIMPIFDKYDNAITRICKDLGRVGIVKEMFTAAKAANPDAELLINDFNTSTNYEILIDGCLQAGVPISTIGIQSHQHQGYWGREKLLQVLERYDHFGLPIHFTENTFVSGPLIPPEIDDLNDYHYNDDDSSAEGEERQMKDTEDMYRILFSHPSVKAITGWDFTDGAWLNAPSGVLRRDNSPKPVYEMLMKLIKNEWWTDCEICTDDNGFVCAEGFKGDYLIIDGEKSAKLKLTDGITEGKIVLK